MIFQCALGDPFEMSLTQKKQWKRMTQSNARSIPIGTNYTPISCSKT